MDETTDDATPGKTVDDARPDQIESEMLFGETIAWMRPNSPLFKPSPVAEDPPESETGRQSTAAGAGAALGAATLESPIADEPFAEDDGGKGRNRRRTVLIAGGALLIVLAGGAAFALTSGGGDDAKVATGTPVTTTTLPPTTTAAPATIPASEGTEKTTAAGTSVTVNADVLFDVNSAELTPLASSRLGAFLTLAQRDAKRHLLVEGFTDSDGDAGFNQQLSEARAHSVAQWLIGQGIDPARISVVGHGADLPVSPNDTPEHKALNRRVVVTLQTAGP